MEKISIYILTTVFIMLSILPAQSKSGVGTNTHSMPTGIPVSAETAPLPFSSPQEQEPVEKAINETNKKTLPAKKFLSAKAKHDGLGGGVYISVGAIIIILLLLIIFL